MARIRMVKGRKILKNEARCKRCGDTLISTDPEKILYCSCLGIHTSGGNRKTLRGGALVFVEELSTFG